MPGAALRGLGRAYMASGGKTPAWQRKEGKSESGGLNKKGVASYRAANPGSKPRVPSSVFPPPLPYPDVVPPSSFPGLRGSTISVCKCLIVECLNVRAFIL